MSAARDRVAWIFDEFPNVAVNFSGGKDSTVVFHLALEEAHKRGRLPLKVMFIDQEAEWRATVDYIRSIMTREDVEPHWLQIPFRMFNATSTIEEWMTCWDPSCPEKWMRPQETFSIKENVYGTDRFGELFTAWQKHEFGDELSCNIGGVRCEESPARKTGLTHYACYKWITWGKAGEKGKHVTLYPIMIGQAMTYGRPLPARSGRTIQSMTFNIATGCRSRTCE
jgi:predicted phosphoadenosine phosphosulfate sulfurtransferase